MKKIISSIALVIVLLSQTGCVIRYKLPDSIIESPENSENDVPVIAPGGTREIDGFLVKTVTGGVEIVRCAAEDANIVIPGELGGSPVVSIGKGAFAELETIHSLTIPDTVTKICGDAFSGCRNLSELTIPDSVTEIGKCAFGDCTSLKSVRLPGNLHTVEPYTFYNCYILEEITIPDSVTSIGKGAFFNCAALSSATLSKKLTLIDADAFYNCFELKKIQLPDSLEFLGKKAFEGCFRMEEITFKGSAYTVYIGDDDFDHKELRLAVNGNIDDEVDKDESGNED